MDGQRHTDRLSVADDGSLDLGSTFFVGGTSNPEQLPWHLYSRMRDFYRGCMWDLSFDGGDIVELSRLRLDQGMILMSPGCAAMPDFCSTASCLHGGICREGWGGHRCYCMLTAYTGRRCQLGRLSNTKLLGLRYIIIIVTVVCIVVLFVKVTNFSPNAKSA